MELPTFVAKKNKLWIWTVVAHFRSGILGWVLGNRSAKTLIILWQAIAEAKLRFFLRNAAQICRESETLIGSVTSG